MCSATTAKIINPLVAIRAWLPATTAATMATMAATDTSGSASTHTLTFSRSRYCASTPSTMGRMTTCTMDQNMAAALTSIHWLASR
ncbi:Uncharacterised protein [Bordetella pertussis]|nr:Uncharacterised protein [Bordetella pertussis]